MTRRDVRKVVGYTRVSTAEQADSGLSLSAQQAAIEAECRRRGWELVTIYSDTSSGKDPERPGLADALAAVKTKTADAIVASRLDRLSRSLLHFADLMAGATRECWHLVALDLAVDTSTAAGELLAHVMGSFAQYERRIISERTKAALQAAQARGTHVGRPSAVPPAIERRIVQARRDGQSVYAITQALNTDKVPTAHGGRRWHLSTVARILSRAA
jgi:DNA invertase Pin-like site-specific DNA recombinase